MHLPWGKWQDDGCWLPLIDHCLDVAAVFQALIAQPLIRKRLAASAGQALLPVHGERLAALACLHDLGKCNWGFQAKSDPRARQTAGHVIEAVALLQDQALWPPAWGELIEEICAWFDDGEGSAVPLLLATLSHHGRPVRWEEPGLERARPFWQPQSSYSPQEALALLAAGLKDALPSAFAKDQSGLIATPALQQRFAGLVMLADWIASDRQFFSYHTPKGQGRWGFAQGAAQRALALIGLQSPRNRGGQDLSDPKTFCQVFGWSPEAQPTPLQRHLAQGLAVDETSRLVLIESATGSGKTEAALAWFLRLYQRGEVDGLYFALPTRVAARELYGRVLAAIERAFPADTRPQPVLLAAPGYVRADGAPILPDPAEVLWDDDEHSKQRARLWAAERPKRFLAAPIAVGTIDQALLSVLKVKHGLLRSVCLDRHLLVVDEVHASDLYMREVLKALLDGHLARGGWALLLSATLGESATSAFFGRSPQALHAAIARPYPSLTTRAQEIPLASDCPAKRIAVTCAPTLEDDAAILPEIAKALEQGARVLVICNTVRRAIALQRAIESYLGVQAPSLLGALFSYRGLCCPHHGRFARADREVLDAEVSARFGKGSADGPLLLIGTQTLEQSLDIDADWLITDLAPMDVLLQRLGRLHRHHRPRRPAPFATPKALVRIPAKDLADYFQADGQLRGPAGLGTVYADGRALVCTLTSLQTDPQLVIPAQNRARIEAATHPESWVRLPEIWKGHAEYLEGTELAKLRMALRNTLSDEPFGELHYGDVDEGQVTARLGEPTWEIPLATPLASPFGQMIDRLSIRAHALKGGPPPPQIDAHPIAEGLSFVIGRQAFCYTRFGLESLT